MLPAPDDREVEALLTGRAAEGGDHAPVAELVALLREATAHELAPPIGPALRAQLDASNAGSSRAGRAARRSALWGATAAAVTAGVALVGMGAADNRLPTTIQDVVSSTADLVGMDVPRSDERPSHDDQVRSNAPTDGSDPAGPGASDGSPGYEGLTPGGADPADPGVPGDQTRAVPAVPPATSDGSGRGDDAPDHPEPGTGATSAVQPTTTETTDHPPSSVESSTTHARGRAG